MGFRNYKIATTIPGGNPTYDTSETSVDSSRIALASDEIILGALTDAGIKFTFDSYDPQRSNTNSQGFYPGGPVLATVPPETQDVPQGNPAVTYLGTPQGHALVMSDREQNQALSLIDNVGVIFRVMSPIKRALNYDYAAVRNGFNFFGQTLENIYRQFVKTVNLRTVMSLVGHLGQGVSFLTDSSTAIAVFQGVAQSLTFSSNHLVQDNPDGNLEYGGDQQTGTIDLVGVGGVKVNLTGSGSAAAPVQGGSGSGSSGSITLDDGQGDTAVLQGDGTNSSLEVDLSSAIAKFTVNLSNGAVLSIIQEAGGAQFSVVMGTITILADSLSDLIITQTVGTLISQIATGPIILLTERSQLILR